MAALASCQLATLPTNRHRFLPLLLKPQRGNNSSSSSDAQLSDGQLNEMLARSEGEMELFEAEGACMQVGSAARLLSWGRNSLKGWGD